VRADSEVTSQVSSTGTRKLGLLYLQSLHVYKTINPSFKITISINIIAQGVFLSMN